jgi:N-acetylneuraminic acid mutarotase
VLVAGGKNPMIQDSSELYDPSTETWAITGSMNNARYSHASIILTNGKVLVTGGFQNDAALNSTELYDPSTETWRNTGSMNNG